VERAVVQDAQQAGAQVVLRAGPAGQVPVGEPQREGVDREVAAREVVGQRRPELDVGQRAGARVRLPPRARDVERRPVRAHGGGPEALVDEHVAPQPGGGVPRHGDRVALDDDVEIARLEAQQQVAHGAADDPGARLVAQRRQDGRGREKVGHAVEER
jgi:hypothetical protein